MTEAASTRLPCPRHCSRVLGRTPLSFTTLAPSPSPPRALLSYPLLSSPFHTPSPPTPTRRDLRCATPQEMAEALTASKRGRAVQGGGLSPPPPPLHPPQPPKPTRPHLHARATPQEMAALTAKREAAALRKVAGLGSGLRGLLAEAAQKLEQAGRGKKIPPGLLNLLQSMM